jgi:hypothetical protein
MNKQDLKQLEYILLGLFIWACIFWEKLISVILFFITLIVYLIEEGKDK